MAIGVVSATIGKGGVNTGGGNLVVNLLNTIDVGNAAILFLGKDNVSNTDGTGSEITSVNDDSSNSWTSIGRFVNGNGAANAGAYVEAFLCEDVVSEITSGENATVVKSTDVDCCGVLMELTKTAGNRLRLAGSVQTLANDAADPGSMTISGLTSKEYIFIRATATESETATTFTATASYANIPGDGTISTTAGGGTANISIAVEYRILTATGDTSNPTLEAADSASIYFALEEYTPVSDTIFAQSVM